MRFDRMPEDWPHRAAARSLSVRPHQWCVVETGMPAGSAPTMLLLHGAGGSGHSFRHLISALGNEWHLVVPDLPGQGFSRAGGQGRLSLNGMSEDLVRLCADQGWRPSVIVGHSAGGAIALRMAEMLPDAPRGVVGVNAALGGFEGAAGVLFPLMARALALLPGVPQAVARIWGTPSRVASLLAATGSRTEPAGAAQYLTLVRDADHVRGTLGMMAQWGLGGLLARVGHITVPTLLVTGSADRTVPPRVSRTAASRMPAATWTDLPGLGHLAHEEAAETVARTITDWLGGLPAAVDP